MYCTNILSTMEPRNYWRKTEADHWLFDYTSSYSCYSALSIARVL